MAYRKDRSAMAADSPNRPINWLRWIVIALALGSFSFAYLQVNVPKARQAGKAPLSFIETRHLALTEATQPDLRPEFTQSFSEPLKKWVPHRTDGVAQPLWPWLAAWFYDATNLSGSFTSAVSFQLGLTLGFLLLLGLVAARNFSLPAALLILIWVGFQGFTPTIGTFTGSTLFYLFFLLTWLACVYGLQRNSLWVYGLIGSFGGLAYLSEDRVLPLLAVFLIISSARALCGWVVSHWARTEGTTLWVWSNHLFGIILLFSLFGFIAGPRLAEAKIKLGQATYSSIDHVRWLEDETSARAWIDKHPDAYSLREISTLNRPTWENYQASHSLEAILERFQQGGLEVMAHFQERGGLCLLALLAVLIGMLAMTWWGTPRACHAGEKLHPETASTVVFVLGISLAYVSIAAWDSAVWNLDHLGAITAPLGLSLVWGSESVLRRAKRRGACRKIGLVYQSAMWLLVLFAIAEHLEIGR